MPNRSSRLDRNTSEDKTYDERTIHVDRVARVVKGGRRFRFRALVVVGDHNGHVGVGIAKSADVTSAITKASSIAKKRLITVPIVDDTIAHEVVAKVGGANILIKPAKGGTGLIAGSAIRTILEVAGVRNVLSKSLGSANKANVAYATIAALQSIQPRDTWVTTRVAAANTKLKAKKES